MTKLFMRSYVENNLHEVKPPLEYEVICISCAGQLGGKMDRWVQSIWHHAPCGCCGAKKEVTAPKNYIWR